MQHYDLVVIGTGSGNSIVDEAFADWRVAIIEEDRFGGTCLNRGCIPSKMLVLAADAARSAAEGEHLDLDTDFRDVDWRALRDRTFGRTDEVSDDGQGYREQQANVEVYLGEGRFVGPRDLEVVDRDGGTRRLSADRIVLATGGRPILPPIEGLAGVDPWTSDTVMRIDRLPRRLGIIGGGYVGCELGHVFASLGCEVTQIEAADHLLTGQDDDVARLYTRLTERRWDLRLGTEVEQVTTSAAGHRLHLSGGRAETDPVVDGVLVVTGRRPNSDRLDLEGTGIEVDDQGLIVVDEQQRATAPGIWALGDASSRQPLKHVANQDARVVRHNLLHPDDPVTSDHEHVPQAVFGDPQVAAIGLTEQQARERDLDVVAISQPFADTAWGWALNEDDAGYFCKLIGDRASGRLLGAHLIGPQSASLIEPLIEAVTSERSIVGSARSRYWIHPAPTEVVEQALLKLEEELS